MKGFTGKLRPTIPVGIARDLDCRSSRFHWPVKNQARITAYSEQALIETFEFTFKIKQSTYLEIFGYARKIVVILEGSEDGVSFGTEIGDAYS